MTNQRNPETKLQKEFSTDSATATPWTEVSALMEQAKIYWLTTVHPEGQPNVSPLFAVWLNDTFYFVTGLEERKTKNLKQNTHCAVTTGCNIVEGIDVIIEGEAVKVSDDILLHSVADAILAKYGWHYEVRDSTFYQDGQEVVLFEVAPVTAFSFGKGEPFSQTRYKF